jgi:hypothetical protein
VFSASGDVLKAVQCGPVMGVTIRGGTIFAQDENEKCHVLQ